MKWEYRVMQVPVKGIVTSGLPEEINIKLNEYGAEGWELVKAVPTTRRGWTGWASYTDSIILFFKRSKD